MKAWEKNVRTVVPYVPGEQPNQPGMIKLNTNENPYPPAPGVASALREMDAEALRLYPDPAASDLTGALAERYGLEEDQVFVGVGSDDVLAMAFMTFFHSGRPILFPDITYSFYDVWADLLRIPYECQPLDENFNIVKENYKKYNGGVIFPNPNAPTGIAQDLTDIEYIIQQNQDVVVIVDEAYIDFGGESAVSLIDKYDNLLVVQTFSKSRSMAGMRIGFAMGNKSLIKYLNDVKYSFNSYTMDRTALVLGVEAVKDEAYFQETTEKIIQTREWTKRELKKLGFHFADSCANFLFVTHEKYLARDLFEALKQKRIYVRYFNKPRIDNFLRITIGTGQEMQALVDFLKAYTAQ
ncbi:histidinol-phosphate transaminase [Murimonas intestini]|uniref:Histidinol-phosphate aminotransferase n=1 Tax=Murimonas intestini TaxID=1337051 RepID=A0AB73T034_9FIRM|nr:histidinol-phosphate transaminase [Murimonas intestini]MCR1843222.1 histidinol-phosphate transaminase [Murimonas intestini]MCR1868549.1 histidinol-phosphate transaminase [Murimonas intestini]MCR1885118.1 histidinol-phosphate transaminase [Murimonas intestini]